MFSVAFGPAWLQCALAMKLIDHPSWFPFCCGKASVGALTTLSTPRLWRASGLTTFRVGTSGHQGLLIRTMRHRSWQERRWRVSVVSEVTSADGAGPLRLAFVAHRRATAELRSAE
jgi:hypothetical protein